MAGTGTPVITKRGNSDNHGPCACPVSRYAEVPQITPIRAASKPRSTGQLGVFGACQRERCPLNWDDGSVLSFRRRVRKGTCQVRLLHSLARTHASFDDPNLVSHAGLVPVMALAQRAGLADLVAEHVRPGAECGINAELKVPCLVAGMAAGADSVDDMSVLRHGAMPLLFGGVRAPSTLGSHLRCYTWGNVSQLEKAAREFLIALAGRAPLLPGAGTLAFIDIDSTQKRVYGHKKQGARFGYTKIQGRSLLVRGLNALAATISTPIAAPVIAATRLRGGNAASARGAASLAVQAIGTAREAGCTGTIVVRLDPAFYNAAVTGAVRRAGARFSITVPVNASIRAAIAAIGEDARTPIRYPRDLGRPAGRLDLRRRGRRDRVHGVRGEEGPGRHRAADR